LNLTFHFQKYYYILFLANNLNTVDWGSGVMGAEAASLKYFQKHSNQLTPHQAARLAAILPNPHRFSPVKPDTYIKMRVKRILAEMHRMPLL
jgi:monofunctional biosynthetic peptidoglycan transglycosylase